MPLLLLTLNLLAIGALFTNDRLISLISFLAYTALNIFFLFQGNMTDVDPVFFTIMILSSLAVYASLSAHSRDQVLTHQKKRASIHLLGWALVIAFFFGHWLLSMHSGQSVHIETPMNVSSLLNGESFMLLSIVVLWMVGKNLYD